MAPHLGGPTKTLLLALISACAPPPPEAAAPAPLDAPPRVDGDLVVYRQADADAACDAHAERTPDTLTIRGPGITDLSGLHCVTAVTAGLAVHDAPDLATLDGLAALTDVGGLSLAHLPALRDTAGLTRLARVSGDIGIWDVPALPALALPALLWVEGDVLVQDAPALDQIDDLRALGGLQGGLHLQGDGVADLSGLDRLGRVLGPVHLAGLAGPAALDGLVRLADAGPLHIEDAVGLTDVDGLSGLRRVRGDLVLSDLPDLEDLGGLHGLQEVDGAVVLAGLPALDASEVEALRDALGPAGVPVVVE